MEKEEIEKTKIVLEKIKRHIEYEETIEKVEDYIQYLEQKESLLDKVTDKLKEEMKKAKEQIKYYEKQYSISKERESGFYIKSFHRQINRWQSRFETCREILNIIEGEKNNGK